MSNHTTLSEGDIKKLAEMMANDPKVLDRLATKLAEKVGDKLFEAGFDLTGINEALARIESKLEQHDRRFDTLDHSIQDLRAKNQLHDGEFRKIHDRFDAIDDHLGINTDQRKRDLRLVD